MNTEASKEQILDGLAKMIASEVVKQMEATNEHKEARLMSVDAAAKYLGRTPAAVRHMIAKGSINCVRRDGRVQLDRSDLDTWVEMGKARG